MSLALAAAVSYDSVLISVSLLSTALIFKLLFDENVKRISYKHLAAFGIIAFILLSIKIVYITLLIPLVFIPKEKYEGKITKLIKYFGIILVIASVLFIINKIPLMNLQRNYTEDHSAEQLQYVITNPISYIKILLKTMLINRNFYILGIIGTFGILDTYIPTINLVIYTICGLAIALTDFSVCQVKFNWKYKLISIFGSIATIFSIFLALYIFWTWLEQGVGAEIITGVQGRYFIPIIPLAMIILSNSVLEKNKTIKSVMKIVLDNSYLVPIIMLCVTSVTIFLRFWC